MSRYLDECYEWYLDDCVRHDLTPSSEVKYMYDHAKSLDKERRELLKRDCRPDGWVEEDADDA
jgi:hypothetical protein